MKLTNTEINEVLNKTDWFETKVDLQNSNLKVFDTPTDAREYLIAKENLDIPSIFEAYFDYEGLRDDISNNIWTKFISNNTHAGFLTLTTRTVVYYEEK